MQTPQDLVGNLMRVARIARKSGPAHLASEAAHWEMQLESRLNALNGEPSAKRRGRPRRVPSVVVLSGAAQGGPVTPAPTQEAA